jgi:modification methylase
VQLEFDPPIYVTPNPRHRKRIPFGRLVEDGLLKPGQILYYGLKGEQTAQVLADGQLAFNGHRGSIHKIAKEIRKGPGNGWKLWYYWDEEEQKRISIDALREIIRQQASQEIKPAEAA